MDMWEGDMVYLKSFEFPDDDAEFDFLLNVKRKCYASFYPFKILSRRRFERIDFEPITMLYGGAACYGGARRREVRRTFQQNQLF